MAAASDPTGGDFHSVLKESIAEFRASGNHVAADDFATPLSLLAHTLAFYDPLTGVHRTFTSARSLRL